MNETPAETVRSPNRERMRTTMTLELCTDVAHGYVRSQSESGRPQFHPGLIDFNRRMGGVLTDAAHDNPYADWTLIKVEAQTKALRDLIAERKAELGQKMKACANGMAVQPAKPSKPRSEKIQFTSTQTFLAASCLRELDSFVREAVTAVHIGAIKPGERIAMIRELTTGLRSLLMLPQHYLRSAIDRSTAESAPEALIRELETRLGGELPKEILEGRTRAEYAPDIAPRYESFDEFDEFEED